MTTVSTTQRRGWVYDPVMSPASKSASQAPKTGDAIHDFYTHFPPEALGSEVLFFSHILLAWFDVVLPFVTSAG